MNPLNEAIAAAEEFIRWARFHLDRPRPEQLEQRRLEAIEKLQALAGIGETPQRAP